MIISLRDAKYYRASLESAETIEIPLTGRHGEYITTCVIYASLLTAGVKAFPCGNGDDVKLTASQHLSVLEYLKGQREALRGTGLKTLAGWHRTGLNIEDYLLPGDAVDDDMVDHFRNILPPLCDRHSLMQVSEPYSSEKDSAAVTGTPTSPLTGQPMEDGATLAYATQEKPKTEWTINHPSTASSRLQRPLSWRRGLLRQQRKGESA